MLHLRTMMVSQLSTAFAFRAVHMVWLPTRAYASSCSLCRVHTAIHGVARFHACTRTHTRSRASCQNATLTGVVTLRLTLSPRPAILLRLPKLNYRKPPALHPHNLTQAPSEKRSRPKQGNDLESAKVLGFLSHNLCVAFKAPF